ncbi:uncharacterized protein A4U43_C10F14120 [Asparagus officinalis]|uniref:Uncharacterized protein n=1 Tax=Asparagus officinalis TaxID=4686 RepID=A0A5P1E2M3_ASPOF|nr:uncharacterized protein A4U43_C10F14120 [Asparagus officinalis]
MAENFGDLGDKPLEFPGLPPIPASHLLNYLMDREDERCKSCIYHFDRLTRANGIMINTFEMLESKPIKALVDGLCVGQGSHMCPIYCIGPLVTADRVGGEGGERHECLKWLDAQPKGSVVFLCFGSMGSFSSEQLKEIANGLERSGQVSVGCSEPAQWGPEEPVCTEAGAQPERADAGGEMVSADEVEAKVRWLMESEGGIELKDRAASMKEAAKAAMRGGGSSDKAWTEFVNTMMSHGCC